MFTHTLARVVAVAAALFTTLPPAIASHDDHRPPDRGTVFTMSNSPDGNRILVFARRGNGALRYADSFPTGGFGTGAGLGNQSGVVVTPNGKWLLAVNAGSSEVSLFEIDDNVLVLRDVVSSGGAVPVSIAVDYDLVYVVNAGDADSPGNISGFIFSRQEGRLSPLPGSTRPLSGDAVGPAQISFNTWGNFLVVTEKATNQIVLYAVGDDGLPSVPAPHASNGATPFGFAFDKRGQLYVSEAFGGAPDVSAMSSYWINCSTGELNTFTASAPTLQTAACWVAINPRGEKYVYTTNTGSSSISGFEIGHDGSLQLLDSDGITASTGEGSRPIDMAFSPDGRFLHALSGGTNTITTFRTGPGGTLQWVDTQGGLPAGTNGLASN